VRSSALRALVRHHDYHSAQNTSNTNVGHALETVEDMIQAASLFSGPEVASRYSGQNQSQAE
jgi:hypothetical protein